MINPFVCVLQPPFSVTHTAAPVPLHCQIRAHPLHTELFDIASEKATKTMELQMPGSTHSFSACKACERGDQRKLINDKSRFCWCCQETSHSHHDHIPHRTTIIHSACRCTSTFAWEKTAWDDCFRDFICEGTGHLLCFFFPFNRQICQENGRGVFSFSILVCWCRKQACLEPS